jgi:predicted DsbA family dithiol-disulfide isomerase
LWRGEQGHQRELKHALLRAYHGEGRNPGTQDVLLERAAEVELDVDAAPSVIINDRHLIQGGQPPEMFEQAIRQISAAETAGD